jgi:outer membrane protein OmpA-like peptidoglycan-associated protein
MAKEMHKHFLARVVDCDGNLIMTDYSANLKIKPQAITIPSFRNSKGELLAQLESESDFALHISKPGYFSVKDESISTKGFSGDTLKRSYVLKPIPYQLPLYLDIVYYDLDKFVIRKDAMPVLDKLSELMNRFSFLDLLVASHTDSRASDEYNIRLSNNRAKAITEYLGTKGINANRVRLEWFGEGKLVNDCGNDKPCPEPKHQLNRRSELVLEAFPDPTKQYEIPEELKGMDFCDPEKIFEEIQEEIKNLPSIYFDFDKDMLRSIQQKDLERTASMLKRMPNLMLQIEGHTDQSGTEHYNNQMLSVRRAKSVIDYLNTRGISQYQIKSAWFGESSPQ